MSESINPASQRYPALSSGLVVGEQRLELEPHALENPKVDELIQVLVLSVCMHDNKELM